MSLEQVSGSGPSFRLRTKPSSSAIHIQYYNHYHSTPSQTVQNKIKHSSSSFPTSKATLTLPYIRPFPPFTPCKQTSLKKIRVKTRRLSSIIFLSRVKCQTNFLSRSRLLAKCQMANCKRQRNFCNIATITHFIQAPDDPKKMVE